MLAPGLAVPLLYRNQKLTAPTRIHGQIHGPARMFHVSHLFVMCALCRAEARDIRTRRQFGRQQVRYKSSLLDRSPFPDCAVTTSRNSG